MAINNNKSSEEMLAARIIALHDNTRLGFRKISRELELEGIQLNKDKVNRIYRKYAKQDIQVEKRSEIEELRLYEAKLRGKVEECKEKEVFRKLLILVVCWLLLALRLVVVSRLG